MQSCCASPSYLIACPGCEIGLPGGIELFRLHLSFCLVLISPQRTSLLSPDRKDLAHDVWKGKTNHTRTEEVADISSQKEDVQLLDPTSLERLLDFEYGLGWNLRQNVLAIRTVILRDGCILCFHSTRRYRGE